MTCTPSGRPLAVKPPHTAIAGIAATFAGVASDSRGAPSSTRCSASSGAGPAAAQTSRSNRSNSFAVWAIRSDRRRWAAM